MDEKKHDPTANTSDAELDSLLRRVASSSESSCSLERLPAVGSIVVGKYRVEAPLGRGGMGAVFTVQHVVTGKLFAIKWLLPALTDRPDAVQRFIREARVSGQVEHANLVEVYDVGQEGDLYFMLMEYVAGETLDARLKRVGRLDTAAACRLLIRTLRGVHAAHQAGVIHRDLKPHNIILSPDELQEDVPKVLDFGISKILPRLDQADTTETAEGVILGTPRYMAPEQLRSEPIDARVDVYALGIIAYQMLSGSLPFAASTHTELLSKILSASPPPLSEVVPEVPQRLGQVVAKAMARDPDQRFESVEALARALEPFAAGTRFATGSAQRPRRPPALALALAAAGLLAALAFAGYRAYVASGPAPDATATAPPREPASHVESDRAAASDLPPPSAAGATSPPSAAGATSPPSAAGATSPPSAAARAAPPEPVPDNLPDQAHTERALRSADLRKAKRRRSDATPQPAAARPAQPRPGKPAVPEIRLHDFH